MLVFWGELLWDHFPDCRRLGGAPANAAYHAAALGAQAVLISRVGRDSAGDEAIEQLTECGVDTRWIQRDDLPTGAVDIEFHEGEPRYHIREPAAWHRLSCSPPLIALLPRARVFCYGTLAHNGTGSLAEAWRCLPDDCLKVCDVNLRSAGRTEPMDEQAARRAIAVADVVKLNQREAEQLGIPDAPIVVITRGADGSEVRHAGQCYRAPGIPGDAGAGDPVGAGDAFTAAFIRLLVNRVELETANRLANQYAAFVASQPGAMPPIPSRVVTPIRAAIDSARDRRPTTNRLFEP